MTKILYIPNGQYIIFGLRDQILAGSPLFTSDYERSFWHVIGIPPETIIKYLCHFNTAEDIKLINNMPVAVPLAPEEFEIIKDD